IAPPARDGDAGQEDLKAPAPQPLLHLALALAPRPDGVPALIRGGAGRSELGHGAPGAHGTTSWSSAGALGGGVALVSFLIPIVSRRPGGGLECSVEAAANRVGHFVVERRQARVQAIALVLRADDLPRIAGLELPARAEIRVRGQEREARHRLLELGGALLPCAPRPELKREPVAHLGRPGAEGECPPQLRLGCGTRPEDRGERLVALEARRRPIEAAADERQRTPAVALLRKHEIGLLQRVAG